MNEIAFKMQSPPNQRCQYPYFLWNCEGFRATNVQKCVGPELKFSITSAVPVAVKAEWIQGKLISSRVGVFFWFFFSDELYCGGNCSLIFALFSSCSPRCRSAQWSANTSSRSRFKCSTAVNQAQFIWSLIQSSAYWNHCRNSLWPGPAP